MKRALAVVAILGCSSPHDDIVGPSGPVTVRVMRDGAPVVAAKVVFSAADGAVTMVLPTDTDGRVTADVEDGGMVTAIDPDAPRLASALSPRQFTELVLEGTATKPAAATLVVGMPTTTMPAETHHFIVETPCETFEAMALPATFQIAAECFAGDRVPVIVIAATENGSLEDPGHGLAFVAGEATVAGGTATLAPGAWSTACTKVDAFVADRMQLTFLPRFGGRMFRATPDFCAVGAPAPGFTYAYPVLDFGEGAMTTSFGYVEGSLRSATLVRNLARLPSQIAVGRDPELLVGDVRLLAMDDRGVEWTRDAALRDADTVIATLTWGLPDQRSLAWKVAMPGATTAIALPTIPGAPALATAVSRMAELRYLDASWLADGETHVELDGYTPAMPLDASLRGYIEQFYPDAR